MTRETDSLIKPSVIRMKYSLIIFLYILLTLSAPSYALNISVVDLTSGSQPTALAAFEQAASLWESWLIDPITVNIEFNFTALGSGILGGTSSNTVGLTFSDVKTALSADATSADDITAVSNLPGGTSMQFRTNRPNGNVFLDNNNTANNIWLDVNIANARALGLYAALDSTIDASIEFSTGFSFDFDPSDGVSSSSFDFVGISAHEIGHALGFVSGVDAIDYFTGSGPGAPLNPNLNSYRIFSVLDLYRYSNDSLALGGSGTFDFATGPHPGGLPYFSIDGATTALAAFETGSYNGTGRQASHWRDDLGIGILDPTAASGELLTISSLDVKALDAIGYNVAPEPVSSILFLTGGAVLWGRLYRKRKIS